MQDQKTSRVKKTEHEMFQHNYILHYRRHFNASCIGSQLYSNRQAGAAENNDIKNRKVMQPRDITPGSDLDSCGGNPSKTH